jgi:hypothetical protein
VFAAMLAARAGAAGSGARAAALDGGPVGIPGRRRRPVRRRRHAGEDGSPGRHHGCAGDQDDPRFVLWQHTFERIGERPWTGFGFGKSIPRTELQNELGDPMLAHAHNLFVSQWLQTGAIGVAALAALLIALAWRYGTFMREADGTLAAIGLVGLVVLVMFVIKNLTDDFMIRPTSKEFWALNALLIGYGIRRARAGNVPTFGSRADAAARASLPRGR